MRLRVEAPGEEMAQIMREDLIGRDTRVAADRFHLGPDLLAGKRTA